MTKSFMLKISVAVLFLALVSNIALAQTPPGAVAKKTEIVMLGTGTGASVRKPSARLLQTLDIVPRLQKVRKKSASPSGGNL